MLRASSLGLAFTHGTPRCYLLSHSHSRCLHKQLCHETQSVSSRIPNMHAEETPEMSASTSDSAISSTPSTPTAHASDANATSTTPATLTQIHGALSSEKTVDSAMSSSSSIPTVHASVAGTTSTTPEPTLAEMPGLFKKPEVRQGSSRMASRDHYIRKPLYEKLVEGNDIEEAWRTYQTLLKDRPDHLKCGIPLKYLHAFASLLVKRSDNTLAQRKRTQTTFLRLLSVLNTIYYTGGQVRLWEWNALIACAGRRWRRTKVDDFQASLNVFRDMMADCPPGSAYAGDTFLPLRRDASQINSQQVTPDVYTYTTLLDIAARTNDPAAMRAAEYWLRASGLAPTRVTYLVYLRFFGRTGQLSRVRSVLSLLQENDWGLGNDGTNALIWAFARNGRLDVVAAIYRVLRYNVAPGASSDSETDIRGVIRDLEEEGIVLPASLKPDAITYYALVQIYAYHGSLQDCLRVFEDMLTSPEPLTGEPSDGEIEDFALETTLSNPVLPIFRSIFLGFHRHAALPDQSPSSASPGAFQHRQRASQEWTLDKLQILFRDFIRLPHNARPNGRTVYWLLSAFAITSGYDRTVLREVWQWLDSRYGWGPEGQRWEGRVRKFRDKIYAEEFDRGFFEQVAARRQARPPRR
ncbi:hypothetical protein BD413DRAFT_259207 [Trametes elegans]|nr:hypothetical protein BD413DRAFT_259207 [Trametes elegans]